MMYYYWVNHGIRPSVFYSMPKGELIVVKAFLLAEQEERRKQEREMDKK